ARGSSGVVANYKGSKPPKGPTDAKTHILPEQCNPPSLLVTRVLLAKQGAKNVSPTPRRTFRC
ncbi:hypothetical protein Ancab_038128, partial [Ancistrocladus abbreviatus]